MVARGGRGRGWGRRRGRWGRWREFTVTVVTVLRRERRRGEIQRGTGDLLIEKRDCRAHFNDYISYLIQTMVINSVQMKIGKWYIKVNVAVYKDLICKKISFSLHLIIALPFSFLLGELHVTGYWCD